MPSAVITVIAVVITLIIAVIITWPIATSVSQEGSGSQDWKCGGKSQKNNR